MGKYTCIHRLHSVFIDVLVSLSYFAIPCPPPASNNLSLNCGQSHWNCLYYYVAVVGFAVVVVVDSGGHCLRHCGKVPSEDPPQPNSLTNSALYLAPVRQYR